MMTFNARALVPTIAGFHDEILANQAACQTDVALRAHDRLISWLDEITADLHDEIEREQQFAAGKGTPTGDFIYEIYHRCTVFERRWIKEGPVSVLDEIHEDIICEGETCWVGLNYTVVPASELEGLAEIFDAIQSRTGIEFIAARV
ncbi:hypothetical protein B5M44_26260 [Shinella sumterensis]|uniref:hypothetical protein n=1 Tax=Shinella sumterensis TaxID=1967501 RepID=UPI00106ED1BB|nr:hypothetical protein [Shinella sumterensis]MCD1265442.1 hypothetical protein [Shinella sumterensis]TFE92447.1 hypothetical protein B5M44_26260 [Shinella sumterensis]